MKKRDYRKRKKVISKRFYKKKSFFDRLDTATPYLLLLLLFSGCVFYYLQFCFRYTHDNISFAPVAFLSRFGNTFEYINPQPQVIDEGKNFESIQIVEHGPRNKKQIALTFDADMTKSMENYLHSGRVKTYADNRITDFLAHNNIKATIFLTGMWMEMYPEETKALAANSLFELANHSYSHPSFSGTCYGLPHVQQSEYSFEIEKTQKLLQQVTNKKAKYFRFPGGCYDQQALDLVKREGMVPVHWDSVADDGFNANTPKIIENVLTQTQNGSIIVMHIGGEPNTPKTFEALKLIYQQLKQKGYTFVTVSELLRPEPKVRKVDLKEYLLSLSL